MNVLLLNPPLVHDPKFGKRPVYPYAPPLGLAYIVPNLRAVGHAVQAADMTYWDADRVSAMLRARSWDFVGVSSLSEQRQGARDLAAEIRRECPGAFLAIGGVHPTLMTKQVVEHWDCDAVVLGEGERTTAALIEAVAGHAPLGDVAGIAFRDEEGRCIKTAPRAPIRDLDTLPFPSYSDFDLDSYHLFTVFRDVTSRSDSKEAISLITSRGCTARCKFCSTFVVWRPTWRARSPKHVVDEIEILHRDYGKWIFNVADDLFTVDEERVIGICQEIVRRKLDICWDCETRVTDVSPRMLGWMKRAGCYSVAYGVESVGDWVLEEMQKETTGEDVYRAFQWTREAGIRSRAMLMVGNPGENERSIDATCRFIEDCRPDTIQASVTMIFPGTALHSWARSRGFIDDEYWLTSRPAPFNTVEHPMRTLKRWEARLLTTRARGLEKILRVARDRFEAATGVRVGKHWVDFYWGDRHARRWLLPFSSDPGPMWYGSETSS